MNTAQIDIRKNIYSRFRRLSDYDAAQVIEYLDTLESSHEPNEETLAALKEAAIISRDPNVKSYSNVEDMMKEILAENV